MSQMIKLDLKEFECKISKNLLISVLGQQYGLKGSFVVFHCKKQIHIYIFSVQYFIIWNVSFLLELLRCVWMFFRTLDPL